MRIEGWRWQAWRVGRFILDVGVLLAVAGIVAYLFVPVVFGYLPRSRASYDSDRRMIQQAVDEYLRASPAAGRPYPTFSGSVAAPTSVSSATQGGSGPAANPRSGPFLDFGLLTGPGRMLVEPPRSAGPINATGIYTGSYNWYLDAAGQVESVPPKGDNYP